MTYHYGKAFANSVFYIDTEKKEFARIRHELFDFENTMTVQCQEDLFAIHWLDCQIVKYSNIMNGQDVQNKALARLGMPRFDSAAALYANKWIYIISGWNGVDACVDSVYIYDINND